MEVDPLIKFAAHVSIRKITTLVRGVESIAIFSKEGTEIASWRNDSALPLPSTPPQNYFFAFEALVPEEYQIGECNYILVQADARHLLLLRATNPKMTAIIGMTVTSDAIINQAIHFGLQAREIIKNAVDPDELNA